MDKSSPSNADLEACCVMRNRAYGHGITKSNEKEIQNPCLPMQKLHVLRDPDEMIC